MRKGSCEKRDAGGTVGKGTRGGGGDMRKVMRGDYEKRDAGGDMRKGMRGGDYEKMDAGGGGL